MAALFVFLTILLVLAIVAIAVWLWLFVGALKPVVALMRIKLDEQVAVWRIESISRISQLEQRLILDEHERR